MEWSGMEMWRDDIIIVRNADVSWQLHGKVEVECNENWKLAHVRALALLCLCRSRALGSEYLLLFCLRIEN